MNYSSYLQAGLFAALIATLAGSGVVIADGAISGPELWALGIGFLGAFFGWMKTHPPVNADGTPWDGVERRNIKN